MHGAAAHDKLLKLATKSVSCLSDRSCYPTALELLGRVTMGCYLAMLVAALLLMSPLATATGGAFTYAQCNPVVESTDGVVAFIWIQFGLGCVLLAASIARAWWGGGKASTVQAREDLNRASADFGYYDADGDGMLSKEELELRARDMELFDNNGDGILDAAEVKKRQLFAQFEAEQREPGLDHELTMSRNMMLEEADLEAKQQLEELHASATARWRTWLKERLDESRGVVEKAGEKVAEVLFEDQSDSHGMSPAQEWQELIDTWEKARLCQFSRHIRREANFIRNNTDPRLIRPPVYSSENCPMVFSRYALFRCILRQKVLVNTIMTCMALAMFAGSIII